MGSLRILPVLFICILPLPGAELVPPSDDISRPGTYTAGRWEYALTVTLLGSKSEGRTGTLNFDGVPLPFPPQAGDAYQTPWGPVRWTGRKTVSWGEHGWMPAKEVAATLPDPATFTVTRVRFCHVWNRQPDAQAPAPAEWIIAGMRQLGHNGPVSTGAWTELGATPITLHDSRHFGQASIAMSPPAAHDDAVLLHLTGADVNPLTPEVDPGKLRLPRRRGTHQVVRHVLNSQFGPHEIPIAIEVDPILTPPKEAIGPVQTSSPWEGLIPPTDAPKP